MRKIQITSGGIFWLTLCNTLCALKAMINQHCFTQYEIINEHWERHTAAVVDSDGLVSREQGRCARTLWGRSLSPGYDTAQAAVGTISADCDCHEAYLQQTEPLPLRYEHHLQWLETSTVGLWLQWTVGSVPYEWRMSNFTYMLKWTDITGYLAEYNVTLTLHREMPSGNNT